jgi:hypothetical protein
MEHFALTPQANAGLCSNISPDEYKYNSCGAVCCAIGWGPAAGVGVRGEWSWWSYCDNNFITTPNDEEPTEAWKWCFDTDWANVDNTAKGAAKRILWLLLKGLPPASKSQRFGNEPLCYADWTPTEADWQLAAEATP